MYDAGFWKYVDSLQGCTMLAFGSTLILYRDVRFSTGMYDAGFWKYVDSLQGCTMLAFGSTLILYRDVRCRLLEVR
jgi:hypothetical protein